jgi:signal transduction histidine kinase
VIVCDYVIVHADTPSQAEHAWQRGAMGSDAYCGIVLAGTVAAVAVWTAGSGRLLAIAAIAAMAGWYVAIGRPAVRSSPVQARTAYYVLGITALLALAQAASAWSSLILFALCPQCFVLLPARWAISAVAAFNLVPVLRQAGHPAAALGQAAVAVGCVAFAATFGRWITAIIKQSRQRADLLATQDEAAYAAGVQAERHRLSAEIHDTLAQGFTSILMLLQAADAATAPEQAQACLSQASRTARENLAEARGLITDQGPADLSGSPLPEALRRITARVAEETGITSRCEVTGDARWLPSAVEVTVLRCAQEALANVRKHSAAATVTVWLDYLPDAVLLRVSDDGTGFDPARERGLGLGGMSNRVAAAGGTLEVRSSPGSGATLTVRVPA